MYNLRTSTPDQHVGLYGPNWTPGVLAEHTSSFLAAGGTVRPAASGSGAEWAVLPDGTAHPMVCGGIVRIDTEDGPIDGRCGLVATDDGACEGHAAEARDWIALTEAERAHWERQHDAEAMV